MYKAGLFLLGVFASLAEGESAPQKSLDQMTGDVKRHIKLYQERMGTKAWDADIAAKDLSVQVGSLMKLMMQLKGERHAYGKSKEELTNAIADELADILSLVLYVAQELNINMDEAWDTMLRSDIQKFSKQAKSLK